MWMRDGHDRGWKGELVFFAGVVGLLIEKRSSPTGDGNTHSCIGVEKALRLRNVAPRQGTETLLV